MIHRESGCGGRRTVLLRKLKRRPVGFSLVNFHHPFRPALGKLGIKGSQNKKRLGEKVKRLKSHHNHFSFNRAKREIS
jgi:hypothetical protein